MQKPKKLFNNTDNIRSEILQGLEYVGMGKIHTLPEYCAVYRTMPQDEQVVIVSGGGSGTRRRRLCGGAPGSRHLLDLLAKVVSMPARWARSLPRPLPTRLSKPAAPSIRATACFSSTATIQVMA